MNIARCSYGSARISDKQLGGDRIEILGNVIEDNFQPPSGTSIVVKNYVIHHNLATESKSIARDITGAQIGGAIGGAISSSHKAVQTGAVIGCSPDDLLGGYTSGESGISNSPIVTVIDLEVDGRTFHFRSVSDTYRVGEKGLRRRDLGLANLERAQRETISRFVPAFSEFLQGAIDGR